MEYNALREQVHALLRLLDHIIASDSFILFFVKYVIVLLISSNLQPTMMPLKKPLRALNKSMRFVVKPKKSIKR